MITAVYNVFDGLELLQYSIQNIRPMVDHIIIVYQTTSNHGEEDQNVYYSVSSIHGVELVKYTPDLRQSPSENERRKRQVGLLHAIKMGADYFIDMDCDEFYVQEEFDRAKKYIIDKGLNGLVVKSQVYFSRPTLTIGEDITLVPFIHKAAKGLSHGINKRYPFAFDKTIRIDPTRQLSYIDGVEMYDMTMHHYSWCRKDFEKKIRNSSARVNIERSTISHDLVNAAPGYFCEFYGKSLMDCSNVFDLPTWQRKNPDSQESKTTLNANQNRQA